MALNPGTAAVLSFLINGLGQLYNGQIKKGLWLIFLSSLSMLVLLVGAILIGHWLFCCLKLERCLINIKELISGFILFSLGLIFICVIGIYSIFDAYKAAKEKSS